MNRKKFLKQISALSMAGIFGPLALSSCSKNNFTKSEIVDSLNTTDTSKDSLTHSDNSRVIYKDTMDSTYYPPLMENYTRDRYCDIVAQNAEKHFPECKPYLDTILKANNTYRTIFDIPPEYHIVLLKQESNYDKDAVSYVSAVGIAQFMRETAKGMGMHVYDARMHRDLATKEVKLKEFSDNIVVLWYNKIIPSLKKNNFDAVKDFKFEYDKVSLEASILKKEVNRIYFEEISMMDDQRKDPFISIDVSARLLAELARSCQSIWGGKPIHNILRANVAYNAGLGNAKKWKGLPAIPETIGYVRNNMVNSDLISPQQPDGLIYDANSQINLELLTNKVYRLRNDSI
jgi:hypothetical protein